VGILKGFAILCLLGIGIGFGWTLGGPSVAQGPPKRHARVTQASIGATALFATKVEKMGGGDKKLRDRAKSMEETPGTEEAYPDWPALAAAAAPGLT
jgi:hypothetical protein